MTRAREIRRLHLRDRRRSRLLSLSLRCSVQYENERCAEVSSTTTHRSRRGSGPRRQDGHVPGARYGHRSAVGAGPKACKIRSMPERIYALAVFAAGRVHLRYTVQAGPERQRPGSCDVVTPLDVLVDGVAVLTVEEAGLHGLQEGVGRRRCRGDALSGAREER